MNVSNIQQVTPQPASITGGKTTRIASLYINDLHGHLDGIGKTQTEVAKFRAENLKSGTNSFAPFVFISGDSYVGGNEKKNNLVVKLQNIIKPDANVYGNHEFDWKGTLGLSARTDHAKFPTLALNLIPKPDCALDDDYQAERLAKSIVVEKNGEKFGLIGLIPSDFLNRLNQETKEHCKDIDVLNLQDTIKSVQEEVDKFEKQGINKIIVISHMGYDADAAIAQSVSGIDVIHGGHSHHVLDGLKSGVNYFTSKRG